LLANCKYLVVDGGSIQEESLIFKKPCLLLRKKQRGRRIEKRHKFLTGLDVDYSEKSLKK